MRVSYNKLWHLLIDRNLKKSYLRSVAKISPATLSKLSRGENVNTDVLARICGILQCDFGDIMEYVPDKEMTDNN